MTFAINRTDTNALKHVIIIIIIIIVIIVYAVITSFVRAFNDRIPSETKRSCVKRRRSVFEIRNIHRPDGRARPGIFRVDENTDIVNRRRNVKSLLRRHYMASDNTVAHAAELIKYNNRAPSVRAFDVLTRGPFSILQT